jgi:hypothetical protein
MDAVKGPGGINGLYFPMEQILGYEPDDPLVTNEVAEFHATLAHARYLTSDENQEIIFPIDGGKDRHSFYNVSQMNWLRLATRLAIEGYRDPADQRAAPSVTIEEFDQFYKDVRDIGIESEFFDYHKWDTARRRFRESNLFLFSANGDMFLDQAEGFQLTVFLGSSKKLASRYMNDISAKCPGSDHSGLYGTAVVPKDCFKKEFFKGIHEYLDHMPGMISYYDGLTGKALDSFQDALVSIGTAGLFPGEKVDNIGSEKLATLLHYTEAAFARFDTDLSLKLDVTEALAAYQVFKPTFAVLVRERSDYFKTDADFEALFTYLLKYGKMPATSIGGATDFWSWQKQKDYLGWTLSADRGRILEIFAELSKKQ